jgi:hypothetical protein
MTAGGTSAIASLHIFGSVCNAVLVRVMHVGRQFCSSASDEKRENNAGFKARIMCIPHAAFKFPLTDKHFTIVFGGFYKLRAKICNRQ